jgi:glyoxylase-like metal-dependent hydrolase (beta-lactamase superfamily II)
VDEYITIATKNKWKIIGVIDTHVHADHLSGAEQLRKKLGVPYYVSRKDLNGDVHPLEKRKELSVGGVKIKPIETPGHTDGSISLLVQDKALLTGDTLFLEGVGRPDLARTKEGAERGAHILFRTLKKIKAMEPSIAILPAHFTSFQQPPLMQSLGELLKTNRALGMSSEDGFVAYILDSLPATPPNYEHIKQLNFKLEFLPLEEGEKLEFGPNRCASG